MPMIYNLQKTFEENIKKGPFFTGAIPHRQAVPKKDWIKLFDYEVMGRLGLAACPFVANARGVKLACELGYDLITWKTIRSHASPAHPYPNFTFLRPDTNFANGRLAIATNKAPTKPDDLACANSIGNASFDLDETILEMKKGLSFVKEGQLFIPSIYGVGKDWKSLIADFVYLAQRIEEIAPHAIELNLSCPNVSGLLYHDPIAVFELCEAVTEAVSVPVIAKLGHFPNIAIMKEVVIALVRAGIRGISGMNSIAAAIRDEKGLPYFGSKRMIAGVSGAPILSLALEWTRHLVRINQQERLELTIFAGGGITMPNQIDLFLEIGANAAMAATGALYNPLLAYEYRAIQIPETSIKKERTI